MLKVVIAHNRYRSGLPSGENAVVDEEIRRLGEAGVGVIALLRDSDEIPALPWSQKALLPLGPIWSPSAAGELSALIKAHRPDVVHLHNPYPLISPWVVRTAHTHGVPVVQTVHNFRHVCVSGLHHRATGACFECRGRVFGLPAIRHACYRDSRSQSAVMAASLALHRSTWRSVDRYFAPTTAIAQHLVDYGIAGDRIVVRPNAVDDPGEVPRDAGHGVLFAGRLSREKGLELLAQACSRAGVPLTVAGDGPLRELPSARMLGRISREQVREAIRASAIVAVPSLLDDVLPTIAIEALANGRPVIGTPLGGIPEIVGPAGWIVEPTVDAWADALPHALEHDLTATARSRYLSRFHPAVHTKALIDGYEELRS